MKTKFLLPLLAMLCTFGCRSAKPPPPVPQARGVATRFTTQAESLSEQQNWSAAAAEWKKSADQFALLNDLSQQAVAVHNQGEAEQEQRHYGEAHRLFESAAALNQKLGRDSEWWRNQIALLQVEALLTNRTDALEKRFQDLSPKSKSLNQPLLQGLFLNELGLWHLSKKEWKEAETAFASAEKGFQQTQNSGGIAAAAANRALVAENSQQFAAAETLWRTALGNYEKLAQPAGIAQSLAGIGRSLLKQNKNLPESEGLLRRAAKNFALLKSDLEKKKVMETLIENLKAQGHDQEAAKILKDLQGH